MNAFILKKCWFDFTCSLHSKENSAIKIKMSGPNRKYFEFLA